MILVLLTSVQSKIEAFKRYLSNDRSRIGFFSNSGSLDLPNVDFVEWLIFNKVTFLLDYVSTSYYIQVNSINALFSQNIEINLAKSKEKKHHKQNKNVQNTKTNMHKASSRPFDHNNSLREGDISNIEIEKCHKRTVSGFGNLTMAYM